MPCIKISCVAWMLNDSSTLVYGEMNRWIKINVGKSRKNGHVEIAMASVASKSSSNPDKSAISRQDELMRRDGVELRPWYVQG